MRGGIAVCVLFLFLANALMVSGNGGVYGTGTGAHERATSRAVTLIYNVYDLQNMSLDLKGAYELANDIDASDTVNWNNGTGFAPVGNQTYPFNGTLDGKSYTITGLFIDLPSTDRVGLFGQAGNNNSLKNIVLGNINVTGREDVGGLVGFDSSGMVYNSFIRGKVSGRSFTGGLAGSTYSCTVDNSSYNGIVAVTGDCAGGLVAADEGTVSNSTFIGNVNGTYDVGGIAGLSEGVVDRCHADANVTGTGSVGGLVGDSPSGTMKDSYFMGNLSGTGDVGGLLGSVGGCWPIKKDTMLNSHYNISSVSINGGRHITMGALFDAQYQDWFSNGLTLDISDYSNALVPSGGYYDISDVQGLRALLGFADVSGYNFRLASDLDLSNDSGLYIPYLAAVFDGDNHTISNQDLDLSFVTCLGMFGFNNAGTIMNTGIVSNQIDGYGNVGGIAGINTGSVDNSYATGNVNGSGSVGGLVGDNDGSVNNSYATGNVNGGGSAGGLVGFVAEDGTVENSFAAGNVNGTSDVGGLVGYGYCCRLDNSHATGNVNGISDVGGLIGFSECSRLDNSYATGNVNGSMFVGGIEGDFGLGSMMMRNTFSSYDNFHYDVDKVLINGGHHITRGGLFDAQFQDWFTSNLSLNISDYNTSLVPSGDYYDISDVQGLRDLLGFSDVGGYKFRLAADIDLSGVSGLYIPYLAAEFDGDNHTISNLCINMSFGSNMGMFGLNCGIINNTRLVKIDVQGYSNLGGLVGYSIQGTETNSYATGNVIGIYGVGGLVGTNGGQVSNSFATGNVAGSGSVGGLVGYDEYGSVRNSYATGNVNGSDYVGGLVGFNIGIVSNSYAAGNVSGTNHTGGLVGCNAHGGVNSCFWDNETSGQNSSSGGTGKTTAEMKTQSTFTNAGWDFNNTWCMIENVTYPVFQWQDILHPIADAGIDQTVDVGTVVTFDGRGSSDYFGIANYTWTFRDVDPKTLYGVGPTYKFNDPGIFNVTLKVTNVLGNWDVDTTTITVNDITPPVSNAGPDQIVNEGTLVTFNGSGSTAGAGIVDYTWTFNDGTGDFKLHGAAPSHTFNTPGFYVVTLKVTDARGNWAIDTMNITVKAINVIVKDTIPPVAEAGPDQTVDEGATVVFDGSASTDNVGVVNYSWKFIDGGPVTLYGVRPAYRFDHPGKFVVTLGVSDAAVNRGYDAMTVTVRDIKRPVADAGPDQVTDEGAIVYFDGTGSFDNVGVVNYTWTFMNGAPVALYGARPTYIFDKPGIFTVSLNVTDVAGNWNIDSMTVTVKDITAPVADAGPDQTVDQGTMVTFNGSGSSDNVGIVNYTWTFYCGTQKIVLYGVSPSFTFSVPGVYHVQLNVSDAAGFRGDDVMTLAVRDITPPVAVAGQDQRVPAGSIIVLDGSLSTDNCGIASYFWNFTYNGKAQNLEGRTVQFKFDRPGVYEVVLTVIDGAGNRGEDRVVITVEPLVKVDTGNHWNLQWMPVLLMAIAVAGIAGYVVMRKRRGRKGGPMQENDSLSGSDGRSSG